MGGGWRRTGAAVLLGGLLLTASACSAEAAADPADLPAWPPGAAGRACSLLDLDAVEDATGTRFDAVGGSNKDDTYSCALTVAGAAFPDLTLSMSPSAADDVIFRVSVMPAGAIGVKSLGRSAYQAVLPSTVSGHGPTVEVGWLSKSKRILVMRYTSTNTMSTTDAEALSDKLVAYAKSVEIVLVA